MEHKERILYLDVLRVIAIFAVIIFHIAGLPFKGIKDPNFWEMTNMWFCGVPVFVMISGALFLNPSREVTIHKLYTKNIFRLISILLFWSVIYACVNLITEPGQNTITFFRSIVAGHFHLWFLYMLLGLYMIVPVLRPICKDLKLTRYFLVLFIIFSCLFPTIAQILSGLKLVMPHNMLIPYLINGINSTLYFKMHLHFTLGYITCFVLGYYMSRAELSSKQRKVIYVLGILGVLLPIFFVESITRISKVPFDFYSGPEKNVFVLFATLAVFVFVKYNAHRLSGQFKKIFTYLASSVLGIYLTHIFVQICLIKFFNLLNISFNPLFAIPLIALIIFIISLIITEIIKKIPILNKYTI